MQAYPVGVARSTSLAAVCAEHPGLAPDTLYRDSESPWPAESAQFVTSADWSSPSCKTETAGFRSC